MKQQLKEQVAAGTQWTMGEKVATALVQFVVRILILRLLMPDDLKVLALLLAFASFALVMVDSGFSQMLLRKGEPTSADYHSVFYYHLTVATLLYLLLVAVAPLLARYYAMPILTEVAALFFLMIPLNALCVLQQTLFTRQFRFALISKITFAAQLISGLAAIALAYAGCGVWALVWQQVLLMAVRAVLLWGYGKWRPQGRGSMAALREMAPYSVSVMASDLVTAIYNKVPQLFLGKMYADATLGYYDQAIKLKELPVQSALQSVQVVTFPALAKIADEHPKFAESYRQVLMMVAYAMFPVMVGMAAVAYDLFAVLLGEQWMPTVPLFEVICLAGLFTPLAMMAYNVLKVKADGRQIICLEVLKKAVMTLLLALSIPHSVEAVVWALVGSAAFDFAVNLFASLPLARLSFGRVVRTLLPILVVTGTMYAAVRCVPLWMSEPTLLRLLAEMAVGVAVYLGLSWLFRLEAFCEAVQLVKNQLKRAR